MCDGRGTKLNVVTYDADKKVGADDKSSSGNGRLACLLFHAPQESWPGEHCSQRRKDAGLHVYAINDFGLEGNTHVQVAVVQPKTKMTLDRCQIKPTCKAGVPDKCSVSSASTFPAAFSSQLMASILIVLLASAVAHHMH